MRPTSTDGFEIAIICALALEADAVEALFDDIYESRFYPKQFGDENIYCNGRIGAHNVVLCYLPGMGKGGAASVTSSLLTSYPGIKLALVVGVCGGVPFGPKDRQIYLGDIIISDSMVEYDFGRQYPARFQQKPTLRKPKREIRSLLASLQSTKSRVAFEGQVSLHLQRIQQSNKRWRTPLSGEDLVFESSYHHKHHGLTSAICHCFDGDEICEEALVKDCKSLGCDVARVIRHRNSLQAAKVHFGCVASADTVMKSGVHRDKLMSSDGIIGLEMEGAGVWDNVESCIIIKGVCDYADSHKNKKWQNYAAATGAAATKTFLQYWKPTTKDKKAYWMVPFDCNQDFTGRQNEIKQLLHLIYMPNGPSKLAITGLGGIGKTHIALEVAYRLKKEDPEYSVFWVSCASLESIEQSFSYLVRILGVLDITSSEAREYFKVCLSDRVTKWLLILDNIDDPVMWDSVKDFLPKSEQGRILITTRNKPLAVRATSSQVIPISEPDEDTGIDILRKKLTVDLKNLADDRSTAAALLNRLTYLPLAIVQAASYINENNLTLSMYLELFGQRESEALEMLNTDFTDKGRYDNIPNSVATTWLVSFHQIQQLNPTAADYLRLMACLGCHDIPQAFLPPRPSKKETQEALGLLAGFSFTTRHPEKGSFSLHPLVHLVTRGWMRNNQNFQQYLHQAAGRLKGIFLDSSNDNRRLWREYLPHVMALLDEKELRVGPEDDDLAWKAAQCLWSDGRYNEAQRISKDIMERRLSEQGDGHPSTLTWMSWVSFTYSDGQRWEYINLARPNQNLKMAEELEWKVLKSRRQMLGLGHRDTIQSIIHLSRICGEQGKRGEAARLHLELLKVHIQNYGPMDPLTLSCMSDIATGLASFGEYDEEIRLREYVLKARQKVLGPNHSDTLTSMHDLACAYRYSRRPEAIRLLNDVIEARKLILGPQNLSVLSSMVSLSELHKYRDPDREEQLLVQSVKIYGEVIGLDHPDTVRTIFKLAWAYWAQGRRREAEERILEAIEVCRRRADGLDHPALSESMFELARMYSMEGRLQEAKAMKEQAVKIKVKEHVLGSKSRQVIESKCDLAWRWWLRASEEDDRDAKNLMAEVLPYVEEVFGVDDEVEKKSAYLLAKYLQRRATGISTAENQHHKSAVEDPIIRTVCVGQNPTVPLVNRALDPDIKAEEYSAYRLVKFLQAYVEDASVGEHQTAAGQSILDTVSEAQSPEATKLRERLKPKCLLGKVRIFSRASRSSEKSV